MSKNLTKRAVEQIEPPDTGVSYVFGDPVRGFGVRVTASGAKSFIWQGNVHGRKQRITIGRFSDITVEKARDVAKTFAGQVAEGKDPRAERHRHRVETLSLRQAFDEYLANRDLKERTQEDVRRAQAEFSDWLARPVTHITREMVARRHRKLGRKSPARANLVMRYLRAVLNFTSEANAFPDGRPLLPDNPVKVLTATNSWFRLRPRSRSLAIHELPRWLDAVQRLPETPDRPEGTGKSLPTLKTGETGQDFFMLLLLTGLRRSEALNLKWTQVDLDGRTLTIPDPKNRNPHTLPLSDYLFELLSRRRETAAGEFVFTNPDGKRFSNLRYPLKRIEQLCGIHVSCHDLRRTFATVAESLDIPAYAVKALLNHKTSGDVTAGYIQMTPERLRKPMQRITDYFLSAGGLRAGATVTEINRATKAGNDPALQK